jgi:hypothetical protein
MKGQPLLRAGSQRSVGSTLCFLAAALHAIAAGLAFRLARSIRYRWGWVLIALAMGLQAVRRVSVGVDLLVTGGPLPTSEWLALVISLLFLVGTIALQGFFQESRQDADFRVTMAALKRVHAIQNLILERNVLGLAFIQERRFVWSNPRAAEMFGIPLDRLLGSPSRIIYPDDAS